LQHPSRFVCGAVLAVVVCCAPSLPDLVKQQRCRGQAHRQACTSELADQLHRSLFTREHELLLERFSVAFPSAPHGEPTSNERNNRCRDCRSTNAANMDVLLVAAGLQLGPEPIQIALYLLEFVGQPHHLVGPVLARLRKCRTVYCVLDGEPDGQDRYKRMDEMQFCSWQPQEVWI